MNEDGGESYEKLWIMDLFRFTNLKRVIETAFLGLYPKPRGQRYFLYL